MCNVTECRCVCRQDVQAAHDRRHRAACGGRRAPRWLRSAPAQGTDDPLAYEHLFGGAKVRAPPTCARPVPVAAWPLHDTVITNIVWCMAYKQEVGGGVVY